MPTIRLTRTAPTQKPDSTPVRFWCKTISPSSSRELQQLQPHQPRIRTIRITAIQGRDSSLKPTNQSQTKSASPTIVPPAAHGTKRERIGHVVICVYLHFAPTHRIELSYYVNIGNSSEFSPFDAISFSRSLKHARHLDSLTHSMASLF